MIKRKGLSVWKALQRVEKGVNLKSGQSYTLRRLREIELNFVFRERELYRGTVPERKAESANAA